MVSEREKLVCARCDGAGRVVDESQAGEPVSTCMACKGNGWVYADRPPIRVTTDQKPNQVNSGWLRTPPSPREMP